jgi:hypothetical protein
MAELVDRLRKALADRYTIQREHVRRAHPSNPTDLVLADWDVRSDFVRHNSPVAGLPRAAPPA